MKNKIFNTTFENMLRMLLLLSIQNKYINSDRIVALDFICIYGKKCKILDYNLHGNNEFGFAEFSNKRKIINDAISLAVKKNLIAIDKSECGLAYALNDRGKHVVANVESIYSKKYIQAAIIVCKKIENKKEQDILEYICNTSLEGRD